MIALVGVGVAGLMLPWIVLIMGCFLVFGAVRLLVRDNADRRKKKLAMQESREREFGYRAEAENLEWLLAGNYEGQFSTPTMPLTRTVLTQGITWRTKTDPRPS